MSSASTQSTSPTPTSTSTEPSSSSSSSSPTKPDKSLLAITIPLTVIGILVVIAIIIATIRFRRRKASLPATDEPDQRLARHRSRAMSLTHPASRITPFGSVGGESPTFVHSPGRNMRIANRRPDGVWEFGDPSAPFSPSIITDLDYSSSRTSLTLHSCSGSDSTGLTRKMKDLEHGYGYVPETPMPPPAYTNESYSVQRYLKQ